MKPLDILRHLKCLRTRELQQSTVVGSEVRVVGCRLTQATRSLVPWCTLKGDVCYDEECRYHMRPSEVEVESERPRMISVCILLDGKPSFSVSNLKERLHARFGVVAEEEGDSALRITCLEPKFGEIMRFIWASPTVTGGVMYGFWQHSSS